MTELMRACDFGAAALGWLSLKYSLRLRGGRVLLSRSAIKRESLSGDEERSGDSGEDRGGVNSRAASTQRTRFDGLRIKILLIKRLLLMCCFLILTCSHCFVAYSLHQSIHCCVPSETIHKRFAVQPRLMVNVVEGAST